MVPRAREWRQRPRGLPTAMETPGSPTQMCRPGRTRAGVVLGRMGARGGSLYRDAATSAALAPELVEAARAEET
eukprot:7893718-Alexandrium_andersonii.AAC.1